MIDPCRRHETLPVWSEVTRVFAGRYELGDTLGAGALSHVHLARDTATGRDVVVKVMRADLARDPGLRERFRREGANLRDLVHPGIVALLDAGESRTEYGPLPYLVLEHVDGRSLRDIIADEGPLPEQKAFSIIADVCAALDVLHSRNLVHGGIRPADILVTDRGTAKLSDLTDVRPIHALPDHEEVRGYAQYMAPEQARGEALDGRTDVYALGCVLYEMLTGEQVFTGDSPVAIAYRQVREAPRAPSETRPQLSAAADWIVLTALAKRPSERHQSAAALRAALLGEAGRPSPIAPAAAPFRPPAPATRRSTPRPFPAGLAGSAAPQPTVLRLKNPQVLKLTPVGRRETALYDEPHNFDNSKSSSTSVQKITIANTVRFQVALHTDRTRVAGGKAGVKVFDLVNLEGRIERQIVDKRAESVERELSISQTSEISIPARKHVRMVIHWKLVWEEGFVTLGDGSRAVAEVPYEVTARLRYDMTTEDLD